MAFWVTFFAGKNSTLPFQVSCGDGTELILLPLVLNDPFS